MRYAKCAVRFCLWTVITLTLALASRSSAQDFPVSTSPTNVGYIDSATVANRLRFRFDAGYGLFPPDRAEFFYANPNPGSAKNNIDYQDISAYVELARNNWLSGFVEAPLRFVNPEVAENARGIADINLGVKAALLTDSASCTTFQLRAYLPTGDDSRRLGTGNVNLEPALLHYQKLTDRWLMESEFRTWIPVTGNDFAGTVLRYGTGVSYKCGNACYSQPYVSPVFEVVGWSVLNGKSTVGAGPPVSAAGDTIVNAKLGLRLNYKSNQFYGGFGQVLTGDHWYEQVMRFEYRMEF